MNRRNAVLAWLPILLGCVTAVTPLAAPSSAGRDVKAPVVIKRVEPVSPPDASDQRVQGVVIIEAVISTEGRVTSTKVLQSVDPRLDEAARSALVQWECGPGTLDGKPVEVHYDLTFNFRLE